VSPILNYGGSIWGFKNYNKIDTVYRRAMRYFLGVHRFAPNHVLEGDMAWSSAQTNRHVEMIRLWNRLVCMSSNRLTRKLFEYDISHLSNNWSSEVKEIMSKIGKIEVFTNQTVCEIDEAKQLLDDLEILEWENSRYSKPKLRYYNMYKTEFGVSDYVLFNIPKYKRSLMAQFRAGILPLEIETGRFRNTPLNERICKLCNLHEIEDEYHFLLRCEMFDNERQTMFSKCVQFESSFLDYDDFEKFMFLNMNCQRLVANFIYNAMKLRSASMYH